MKQIKFIFKTITVLIFLVSFISEVGAQESHNPWATIATVSNVTVSYQSYNCQGVSKMYLKIENNNATSKTVSWSFWDSGTFKNITLDAGETQLGSCNINSIKELSEIIPSEQSIEDLNAIINVN